MIIFPWSVPKHVGTVRHQAPALWTDASGAKYFGYATFFQIRTKPERLEVYPFALDERLLMKAPDPVMFRKQEEKAFLEAILKVIRNRPTKGRGQII